MGKKNEFYYAVHRGILPGIYRTWKECEKQVKNYPCARFKKFETLEEATSFVKDGVSFHTSTRSQPATLVSPCITLESTAHGSFVSSSRTEIGAMHSDASDSALQGNANACCSSNDCQLKMMIHDLQSDIADLRGEISGLKTVRKCTRFMPSLPLTHQVHLKASGKRARADVWNTEQADAKKVRCNHPQNHNTNEHMPTAQTEVTASTFESKSMIHIYTDGACENNGEKSAKAGIGVYWGPDHPLNVSERLPGRQTNNRAEIQAAVRALHQARSIGATNITLYTDSKFLIRGITEWIHKWKQNGWKLADGQPVKNQEDFEDLSSAAQGLNVQWVHVRGHRGNIGNVQADKLAVAALSKPSIA